MVPILQAFKTNPNILKRAIDYFRNAVHILYIDGCHCTDGWKILLCSFMDCNHSIQPIGFELCQGESNTSWVTFDGS